MKKATVHDLRYRFAKIEQVLRAGEEIQITKRNRIIARLVPEGNIAGLPDIMARLQEIYGDTRLDVTGAQLISEEREGR